MKSRDGQLTPQEEELYNQALQTIRTGPFTPATIGESLWTIETYRLHRQSYDDVATLYSAVTNREPEEYAKLIAAWKETPRSQEVTSQAAGAMPAKSSPRAPIKAQPSKPAGAKNHSGPGAATKSKAGLAQAVEAHTPAPPECGPIATTPSP